MINYFINFFSDKYDLAVFLISLIPTFEGRVAIPFAFATSKLTFLQIFFISFLGCIVPSIFIIPLTKFFKRKTKYTMNSNLKIRNILNLKNDKDKIKALILFIAIPLPLTGVWSGSLIAGLSNLTITKSYFSVVFGGAISTLIITIFSYFFKDIAKYLLYFSLILILFLILIKLIKKIRG